MGFGPPAAIGAKIARPRPHRHFAGRRRRIRPEPAALATAVEHKLAIVWLVMNNNAYGTIAGLQKAAYGLTHGTLFPVAEGSWSEQKPNYAEIARAPTVAKASAFKSAADLRPRCDARWRRQPYVLDVPMKNNPTPTTGHWNILDIYCARQAARARSDRLIAMSREIPRQRSGAARRPAEYQDDHADAGQEGVDHRLWQRAACARSKSAASCRRISCRSSPIPLRIVAHAADHSASHRRGAGAEPHGAEAAIKAARTSSPFRSPRPRRTA
jgi:hypothetical protein